jgi:hypothetical protein
MIDGHHRRCSAQFSVSPFALIESSQMFEFERWRIYPYGLDRQMGKSVQKPPLPPFFLSYTGKPYPKLVPTWFSVMIFDLCEYR